MYKFTRAITLIISSLTLQLNSSVAEDIEIYQGGDSGVRPNVMFVLDTSGSMNEKVVIPGDFYDSEEIYPGPFRNDRLYYYEFPETGSDLFDIKAIKDDLLNNTIHPDSFKCETMRSTLASKGYAVSKFLQWDPSVNFEVYYLFKGWKPFHGVWRSLRSTDDPARYVDCKPDIDNNHGLTANDGRPYMTHDENGQAYTSDYSKRVPNLLPVHIFRPAIPGFAGRGWWGIAPRLSLASTETVYTGNYLNYDFATQNGVTKVPRLYFMGQIISDMVAQYPGLNVGITRFDGRLLGDLSFDFDGDIFTNPIKYDPPQGGMVAIEMMPSEGNALRFENTIKSWDAWGMTPLSESYYEAARYLRGDTVKYGDRTKVFATRDSFLGFGGTYHDYPSVAGSRLGNVSNAGYESPITESCQGNHIIVFSDGMPVEDTDANSDIQSLISGLPLEAGLDSNCSGDGECADELAYYLSTVDQFSDPSDLAGTQTIRTHAISGFVTDAQKAETDRLLRSMSETHGQGIFASAQTEEEIRNAFRKIFDNITTTSTSFTAPVVSVNAFNRLEFDDNLYYSVFKPSGNLSWDGNVKHYVMGQYNDKFSVLDANGDPAIDEISGNFSSEAQSIWTLNDKDGFTVTRGGIASRLPDTRKAFTSNSSGKLIPLSTGSASKAQLGIEGKNDTYHSDLITWAKGDGRKSLEDPLHSEPTVITYTKDKTSNKTERSIFLGTNSGFLHAFDIDDDNPSEHFTFIPKELLQNLEKYHTGGGINANKAYGIDGPITHWHQDLNGDGQVNNDEKVYLYITLRRGGQSLYALDISDRDNPELLWEKHGNYPADFPNRPSISSGYENLGQTWGRLEPTSIQWQKRTDTESGIRVVLMTSGGYDPAEDGSVLDGTSQTGPIARQSHSIGTTLYMIDALTGEVLWDAKKDTKHPQLKSSFPANASPVDITGNGLVDILYAADVGGRIWRFNLGLDDDGDFKGDHARVIADLNSGPNSGNRRFYNEVDLIGDSHMQITVEDKTYERAGAYISIGSGNRSHPKTSGATFESNFHYIIKDQFNSPMGDSVITHADLTETAAEVLPATPPYGWRVPLLLSGEKALSRSNSVGDQILFTTFTPVAPLPNSCDVKPGLANVYRIDLSASKVNKAPLITGGIPATPMLIPPKKPSTTGDHCSTPGVCDVPKSKPYSILVGTEVIEFDTPTPDTKESLLKEYWMERY